jgi:hypothetical protein
MSQLPEHPMTEIKGRLLDWPLLRNGRNSLINSDTNGGDSTSVRLHILADYFFGSSLS